MDVRNQTNRSTEAPLPVHLYIEPHGSRVFRPVLFSFIILASLVGNALVLKAVIGLHLRCKPFAYYLVANLAVAEVISSICQPFVMTYQEKYTWIFGDFACKLLIPLQVLATIVVTFNLAAIAVYRYRALTITSIGKKMTSITLATVIGVMWVLALSISLPLFVTRILMEYPPGNKVCVSKFSGIEIYNMIRFALTFLFPYLIMSWSYGAVALKIKRHIRHNVIEPTRLSLHSDESRDTHDGRSNRSDRQVQLEYNKQPRGSRTGAEQEFDLLRMIYVIIISFVVCYAPYQALFLWEYTTGPSSWRFPFHEVLRNYFYVLTCLPGAIHPLCYGTMNRFFARAFSRIVMCRR